MTRRAFMGKLVAKYGLLCATGIGLKGQRAGRPVLWAAPLRAYPGKLVSRPGLLDNGKWMG